MLGIGSEPPGDSNALDELTGNEEDSNYLLHGKLPGRVLVLGIVLRQQRLEILSLDVLEDIARQ